MWLNAKWGIFILNILYNMYWCVLIRCTEVEISGSEENNWENVLLKIWIVKWHKFWRLRAYRLHNVAAQTFFLLSIHIYGCPITVGRLSLYTSPHQADCNDRCLSPGGSRRACNRRLPGNLRSVGWAKVMTGNEPKISAALLFIYPTTPRLIG